MSAIQDWAREPTADVKRIVILGGGFAGVYAARHLERVFRGDASVHLTLISKVNYFLMTPLLFEAGSGVLEPRHAVNPIRPLLSRARFIQAEVKAIDLDSRIITAHPTETLTYSIPYDHLVLTLGGTTNTTLIPGSENARTFKTLADAIDLRNHVIQAFERADIETNPQAKRAFLTVVVVGAGLVGVELVAELTDFLYAVSDIYRNVRRDEIRIELIEGAGRIIPELEEELSTYAARVLERRGIRIRLNTRVKKIEPGRLHLPATSDAARSVELPGEVIESQTIIVATGVLPNPLVAALPLEKDPRGRTLVHPTLQSRSHPDVWALGDCASIPDPQGKPYPPLAQHALREARTLANNVAASIRGQPLQPFVYSSKGTLAALGHFQGVGRVYFIRVYGFIAWWVWRTYYLMQMPQWSRRLRIVIDWTIALFFKNDIVELDLHTGLGRSTPTEASGKKCGDTQTEAARDPG